MASSRPPIRAVSVARRAAASAQGPSRAFRHRMARLVHDAPSPGLSSTARSRGAPRGHLVASHVGRHGERFRSRRVPRVERRGLLEPRLRQGPVLRVGRIGTEPIVHRRCVAQQRHQQQRRRPRCRRDAQQRRSRQAAPADGAGIGQRHGSEQEDQQVEVRQEGEVLEQVRRREAREHREGGSSRRGPRAPRTGDHDEGQQQRERCGEAEQPRVAQDAEQHVVRVRLPHREAECRRRRLPSPRHGARADAGQRLRGPGRDRVAPQEATVDERPDRQRAGSHEGDGQRDPERGGRDDADGCGGPAPRQPNAPQPGAQEHRRGDRDRHPARARPGEKRHRHADADEPDLQPAAHPWLGDEQRQRQSAQDHERGHRHRAERRALVAEPDGGQPAAADHEPLRPAPEHGDQRPCREEQDRDGHDQRGRRRPVPHQQQGRGQHRGRGEDRRQRPQREPVVLRQEGRHAEREEEREERQVDAGARQLPAAPGHEQHDARDRDGAGVQHQLQPCVPQRPVPADVAPQGQPAGHGHELEASGAAHLRAGGASSSTARSSFVAGSGRSPGTAARAAMNGRSSTSATSRPSSSSTASKLPTG